MVKGFLNEWKAGFSEICAGSSKNNNYSEVSLFRVSPAPAPIQSLSCSRPSQDKACGDLQTSPQQNQNHITPWALDVYYRFVCKTLMAKNWGINKWQNVL